MLIPVPGFLHAYTVNICTALVKQACWNVLDATDRQNIQSCDVG